MGNFDFRTQDGSLQKGIGSCPTSLPTVMDFFIVTLGLGLQESKLYHPFHMD